MVQSNYVFMYGNELAPVFLSCHRLMGKIWANIRMWFMRHPHVHAPAADKSPRRKRVSCQARPGVLALGSRAAPRDRSMCRSAALQMLPFLWQVCELRQQHTLNMLLLLSNADFLNVILTFAVPLPLFSLSSRENSLTGRPQNDPTLWLAAQEYLRELCFLPHCSPCHHTGPVQLCTLAFVGSIKDDQRGYRENQTRSESTLSLCLRRVKQGWLTPKMFTMQGVHN